MGNSSYGIYTNSGTTTINIDGGEIKSGNVGLYISSHSSSYPTTINVNKGNIIGAKYGIQQVGADSTLNIGKNNDNLSTDMPLIIGGLYGLYKTAGTANFYNGKLSGQSYGYNGEINNVRENYEITEEYEYSGETFTTTDMSEEAITNTAKIGNGYARITYIGETNEICEKDSTYEFSYLGSEETFEVPCNGLYKLETWGAQGGTYNNNIIGGYGGYSYGEISLTQGEILYINVGGQGSWGLNVNVPGGYNGGGYIYHRTTYGNGAGSGGGATHIATSSGLLSTLENNRDKILIVAGGGGGATYGGEGGVNGGSGGGTVGINSVSHGYGHAYGGTLFFGGLTGDLQNHINTIYASFGQGAGSSGSGNTWYGGAGGGGYYGGGYGGTLSAGAGGSGYTGSERLSNTIMYEYGITELYQEWISNYLVEIGDYLQVDETLFSDINEAINSIDETGTIKVLHDYNYQKDIIFPDDKNITLDLNGYSFTSTKAITNNGTLTITNNVKDIKPIIKTTISNTFITNNKTLNISNVEVQGYNTISSPVGSALNIDNCIVTSTNIAINNSGTLDIKNSRITATNQAIVSNGKYDIDNTYISGTNYAIYSNTTVANTIKNSNLVSNSNALYKYSTSTTTINDTEIAGVINNTKTNATLNIIKGTINGTITNTGTSTIRESNISYDTSYSNSDQLINNSGVLTLEDSELRYTSIYNSYGDSYDTRAIYNSGTLNSNNNQYYVNHAGSSNYRSRELVGIFNTSLLNSTNDYIELWHGTSSFGIWNNSANESIINNITIKAYDNSNSAYGINTRNNGNVTINGGEISAYDSNNGTALYLLNNNVTSKNVIYNVYNNTTSSRGAYVSDNATLTIESGELNAYDSATSYGIEIASGTVTLGIEDGSGLDSADVSITNPKVSGIGTTTGIGISIGNGTFNYFDGILIGSTSSRGATDIITQTEKSYQAKATINEETGYQETILEFLK